MSLYAIGDLHLHFQSEVKSKSQRRERIWKKHEEKFLKNCRQQLTDDDTLVLVGDHSWGRKLAECEEDLSFIASLPGRKILLRGNHDQFWDAKKTDRLNELYQPELTFLQNSFEVYEDYAIVGTKGFTFEGPFYLDQRGRIFDWDRTEEAHSWKLIERELQRLEESFEKAKAAGYKNTLCFYTTLRRISWSGRADSRKWPVSMALKRSSTPTATGNHAFMTAFWAMWTGSNTCWCPGTICAGCRRRYWTDFTHFYRQR